MTREHPILSTCTAYVYIYQLDSAVPSFMLAMILQHNFHVIRSAGSSVYNYENPVIRDVVNTGTGQFSQPVFAERDSQCI
jgi:hypothetical protein